MGKWSQRLLSIQEASSDGSEFGYAAYSREDAKWAKSLSDADLVDALRKLPYAYISKAESDKLAEMLQTYLDSADYLTKIVAELRSDAKVHGDADNLRKEHRVNTLADRLEKLARR